MRAWLRYCLGLPVALGLLGLAASCGKAGETSGPPNVLLIVIDTLRADHLGAYGYSRNTSPAIDDLAREGLLFENAVSPASWTKPAVASLFTGLSPLQHRVFTGNKRDEEGHVTSDVLAAELLTVAEALRAAGYRTGGFVRNAHLRGFMGFDQGFDLYDADLGEATEIVETFLGWQGSEPTERFFAYLHLLDVHWPYTPPGPFGDLFDAPKADLDFNDKETWKRFERQVRTGELAAAEADVEAMKALYDGEIRYTDAVLGQLFATLRARDLYEDTLILITSDHGEEFLDHGGVSHGHTLYEEMLHVPLIIRGGGLEPARVAARVELIDILPTILGLVGIEAPVDLPGRDLGRVLGDNRAEDSPVFADHRPNGSSGRIRQSVRAGRHKLIRTLPPTSMGGDPSGQDGSVMGPGVWVEAEVEPQSELSHTALEIERIEPRDDIRIFAPIVQFASTEKEFRLLGVRCRLRPDATVLDSSGARLGRQALGAGDWIKARGRSWDEGILELRKVELLAGPLKGVAEIKAPIQEVLLEGDEPVALRLAGMKLVLDEETEWEGGDLSGPPAPASGAAPRAPIEVELYDLEHDPGELHDLAGQEPRRAAELIRILDDWERGQRRLDRITEEIALDPSTVEELRALGYID